ncbi:MAG: hypothetical protein IT384_06195 [Deltaproteobacteria bacterium]|nr:hypothetical protein [Deltaproteobacteria bacterium]
MLIASLADGALQEVWAEDRDGAAPLSRTTDASVDALIVLQYDRSLAALAIPAGKIAAAPEGRGALLPAQFVRGDLITVGEEPEVQALPPGRLPPPVDAFHFLHASHCLSFRRASIEAPLDGGRITAIVPRDELSVWVTARRSPRESTTIHRADAGGLVAEPEGIIDLAVTAVGGDARGGLYFAASSTVGAPRRFFHWRPESGLEALPPLDDPPATSSVLGAGTASDPQLYAIAANQAVDRLQQGEWSRLYAGLGADELFSAIAWAPPDEVYALVRGPDGHRWWVLHVRADGSARLEQVSDTVLTSVGYHPGLGVVVGTTTGVLWHRLPNDTWETLTLTPSGFDIEQLRALDDSLFYADNQGQIVQYELPPERFCPPLFGFGYVAHLEVMGRGLIAGVRTATDAPTTGLVSFTVEE